jgi:5'-3' exonuclease
MNQKEYLKLLNEISEDNDIESSKEHDRVILIDGLNLFFRNFAMMNIVNHDGVHIGGLGGFIRSIGSLINQIQPTAVYVVFDGVGSSTNRKNLLPEYKSGRHTSRITNWEVFEDLDDEHNSKIDQIVRLVHYLKCLPIRTVSIDKSEADDIIAFYSTHLVEKYNSKVVIVSSDKDFLQLVNNDVTVWRPMEKTYYTKQLIEEKHGCLAENFILYKVLMGDNSDKIPGIKGLGEKGLFKKFPELKERPLTLDDIYNISVEKLKEHVVYARVVNDIKRLETNYKIMDLSKPLIDDNDEVVLKAIAASSTPTLNPEAFLRLYNEDGIGKMIRNIEFWIKDIFKILNSFTKK